MVNADGPQELFIYALTRKGRVETTNYRTVKLPSDAEVPALRQGRVRPVLQVDFRPAGEEGGHADACSWSTPGTWAGAIPAPPIRCPHDELRQLGVFWLERRPAADAPGAQNVFLSRLHLRYDGAHFPEDLVFQETADRENFQGRYRPPPPLEGRERLRGGRAYRRELPKRLDQEAQSLATLTGWDVNKIRGR